MSIDAVDLSPDAVIAAQRDEIARLRRNLQATEQALLDERAAHRNDAVIAAPAHAYCAENSLPTGEWNAAREAAALDALFAAHRATTPSETSATHVIVAVDDLKRIRHLARDGLASSAMAVLDRILGAT